GPASCRAFRLRLGLRSLRSPRVGLVGGEQSELVRVEPLAVWARLPAQQLLDLVHQLLDPQSGLPNGVVILRHRWALPDDVRPTATSTDPIGVRETLTVMSTGATTPMRHIRHSTNSPGPAATAHPLRDGIGRHALAVLVMGCGLAASAGPVAPKWIA